jgi:hypothetical protein
MRRIVTVGLVITLAWSGLHTSLLAAQSGNATLTGRAMGADRQSLSNNMVRLRSVTTGELRRVTTSGPGGEYTFPEITPDVYVLELSDGAGRIVGTTTPFRVEANTVSTMSITANATSALAASTSSGISLFGLGPAMSAVVLGSAGAAAITAVVSTRDEASPSR